MATPVFSFRKFYCLLLITILIGSCNSSTKNEIVTEDVYKEELSSGISSEEEFALGFDINTYLTDYIPDSTESLLLKQNCAVFIGPSEAQLEVLRTQFGSQEFNAIVEDNLIFEITAREMIGSLNICNISTQKRYIVFQKPDETFIVVDTKAPYSLKWNLIFFHYDKDPEVVDMLEVDLINIANYFNIRIAP
jgi:hypothetical protein